MNTLDDNFLLSTALAKDLYHNIAAQLPVIDFHNHLQPGAIACDKKFSNITELWIHDDQYKHRLMRINGVAEKLITGEGTDKQKFLNWIRTFRVSMGNPLFHWSQLEIKAVFGEGIDLFENDPYEIWAACNEQLGDNGIGAVAILKKWNSEILCTSDDLLDKLDAHQQANAGNPGIKLLPSLRGDSIVAFDAADHFLWLQSLAVATGMAINCLADYLEAVKQRLDFFQDAGCALSDHALDSGFTFTTITDLEAERIFKMYLADKELRPKDLIAIRSYVMIFLGTEYGKREMTMQLHIGAQRATSSRLSKIAGKFGGFATIGNPLDIVSLCQFLDSLESAGALPNTILYTLNPADNERLATLTGSFPSDGVTGKIQFGPAWWFNDHYDGIKRQLTDVSSHGLLNAFIGMTSDSRSFMSLSRHYYFRRILCRLLGGWAEKGLLPQNFDVLAGLVNNVCYNNAKNLITKGKI